MGEHFGDKVDQSLNLYGYHVWIFSSLPWVRAGCGMERRPVSRADFRARLAGTLSENSRACPWSRRRLPAIAAVWTAAMHWFGIIMQNCTVLIVAAGN